jgi:hypothetical protein
MSCLHNENAARLWANIFGSFGRSGLFDDKAGITTEHMQSEYTKLFHLLRQNIPKHDGMCLDTEKSWLNSITPASLPAGP